MRLGRLAVVMGTLAMGSQGIAAPIQQSETLSVGPVPTSLAVDAPSGKLVIGNASASRGGSGSVAVLDRSGRLTTIATSTGPHHVAVSSTLRKAVAALSWDNRAVVVDLDTMQSASVPTANNPTKIVIVEKAGLAYVVGKTMEMSMAGGVPYATSNGFISVIDLRTLAVQTYPMPGFAPDDLAASPDGKRLYVVGTHYFRTGEAKPGFIQAFDTAARAAIGTPTRIGRLPLQVLTSSRGDKVYVVGHADYFRADLPADDMRRNSIRPAAFVLDAATLALQKTIELPDTKNLDLFGPSFIGQAEVDPASGKLFVSDRYNARLSAIDLVAGTVRTTEFEAPALSFALNRVTGTAVVTLNTIGQAAIVSQAGVRLDTVPIGRAPKAGESVGQYAVAVDGASGDTYVTNGHDQSISILRKPADATALVNLTDVWFDPADPGWGLYVDHQGIVAFATLFTHDAAGDPTWLAMTSGVRQPDGSFSGVLYRTHGASTRAITDITPVGIMRLTPEAGGAMKLLYVVDGQSHTRMLQRFTFDPAARECGWGVGSAKSSLATSNFTSLWSDPREQGWGVAVSHQGRTAFGVLFHYDAQNRASWSLMSNGRQQAPGVFSGELYRAKRGRIETAGTLTLDFTGADAGSVTYHVDGVDFRAQITRHAMTPLMSRCSS